MSHHDVDARRLLCPMPVIRTQNALRSLAADDTVTVTFTDPGGLSDIAAWCRINGHEIIETREQDQERAWAITVRVVRA